MSEYERITSNLSPAVVEKVRLSARVNGRSVSQEIQVQLLRAYGLGLGALLASGGVDAPGVADPSPGEADSAPPEASERPPYEGPIIADASDLVLTVRDPAEAGVTPGEPSGQAVQAEGGWVAEERGVSGGRPAQGNDLSTWKGGDERSAKFRKLGK